MKNIFTLAALTIAIAACAPYDQVQSQFETANSSDGIIGGRESSDLVSNRSVVGIVILMLGTDTTSGEVKLKGQGTCTGTLIGNNSVMTAAHCVHGDSMSKTFIVFGTNIYKATKENLRPVTKAFVNPRWSTSKDNPKNTGDVAILKFTGTIPSGYSPAKLLPIDNLVAAGAQTFITGYGVNVAGSGSNLAGGESGGSGSGILREATVTIAGAYSETEIALDYKSGSGICNGDSGGPAYINYGGTNYVWGVVSRGANRCDNYGILTNALAYRNWINQAVSAL